MAEWISVKDRLPENPEERVLVKIKDERSVFGKPAIDTDRYSGKCWVRYYKNITHWMPLPEPPKGE